MISPTERKTTIKLTIIYVKRFFEEKCYKMLNILMPNIYIQHIYSICIKYVEELQM